MGEISRQTLKGSMYNYIGILIGFGTNILLFPKFLTTDQIGVLGLIISYTQLMAAFGSFGFGPVILRLFPYFKNSKNGHNGLVFLILLVSVIGTIFSSLGYLLIDHFFLKTAQNSSVYSTYGFYVYPLTFFTLLFNLLDAYSRGIGNAVTGALFKEVSQRILIFIFLGAFILFPIIDFGKFTFLYVFAFCATSVSLIFFLRSKNQFQIQPNPHFLRKKIKLIMISVGFNGVLFSFGAVVIERIGLILIAHFIDASATGIYLTSYFFSSFILIPGRSLGRISSTIVSNALKAKDYNRINSVYHKSSLNQLIIGVLIFIGIWGNIDIIYKILPSEYSAGKYVILFVGLANLINLSLGINYLILRLSKYYRYVSYIMVIYSAVTVCLCFLFIPLFGLTGAALAFLGAVIINTLINFLVVYKKYGFQPYQSKHIHILLIGLVAYFVGLIVPEMNLYIIELAVRGGLEVLVFVGLTLLFRVSNDANELFSSLLKKIGM